MRSAIHVRIDDPVTTRSSIQIALAAVVASVSLAAQTRSLAITRVNVVDVTSGRIVPNSTVVVDGSTTADVTPDSCLAGPGGESPRRCSPS